MEQRLRSKSASCGFVEIAQRDGDGWYLLYVNGKLKAQSASLDYILREFDQYR